MLVNRCLWGWIKKKLEKIAGYCRYFYNFAAYLIVL